MVGIEDERGAQLLGEGSLWVGDKLFGFGECGFFEGFEDGMDADDHVRGEVEELSLEVWVLVRKEDRVSDAGAEDFFGGVFFVIDCFLEFGNDVSAVVQKVGFEVDDFG